MLQFHIWFIMTVHSKMRQILLQNATAILLQNATEVYYKIQQLSQIVTTGTTKFDVYYKLRQYR